MLDLKRAGALILIASGLAGCHISNGAPDETGTPPAETDTEAPTRRPTPRPTAPPTDAPTATREPTPEPTDQPTRPEPTPRDRQAPVIDYTPDITTVAPGESVTLGASVSDNFTVFRVTLFYRVAGQGDFISTTMSEDRVDGYYLGTIPGSAAVKPGIEYYISARDPSGNVGTSPASAPESVWEIDVLAEGETPRPTEPPEASPAPTPTDRPEVTEPAGPTPTDRPEVTEPAGPTPTDRPEVTEPAGPTPTIGAPTEPPTPTEPDPTDPPTPVPGGGPAFTNAPAAVIVGQKVSLTASGGTGPYTYAVETNRSGGTISTAGLWRSGGKAGDDVLKVTDSKGKVGRATVTVRACSADEAVFQRDNGVVTFFDTFAAGDKLAVGIEVSDASFTPTNVRGWFYQLPTGASALQAKAYVYDDQGGKPGSIIAQGVETNITVNWPNGAQSFALGSASRALVEGEMIWLVLEMFDDSPATGGYVLDNSTFNSGGFLMRNHGSGWHRASTNNALFRATGCHAPLRDEAPRGAPLTLVTNDPDLSGRLGGVVRYNPQPAGGQLADRFIVTTGSFELTEVNAYFLFNTAGGSPQGLFKVRVHEDAGGQPGQVIGESGEELATGSYPTPYTFTLNLPVYFLPGEAFWITVTSLEDQTSNLYGLISDNGIREDDDVFTRQSALTRTSSAASWAPLTFLGNEESLLVQAVGLSTQGNATGDVYTLDFTTLNNSCGFGAATGTLRWAYDPIDGRISTYTGWAFKPFMWVTGAGTSSLTYRTPQYRIEGDNGVQVYHYEGEASLNRNNFGGTYRLVVEAETTDPNYSPCTIEMAVIGSK